MFISFITNILMDLNIVTSIIIMGLNIVEYFANHIYDVK